MGTGCTAQWADDVHHSLHAVLTGESQGYYADFATADLTGLAHVLTRAFLHEGTWSSFRGRNHGAPVDTRRVPGHRFVTYLQNHDQVGNRAVGDRHAATLTPGLVACGAAILFCSPFTPMVFMGEEWGARTPWQFFAHFPDGARTTRCARAVARSSPSTAGAATRRCPTRRPSRRSGTRSSTGPSRRRSRTRRCSRTYRELIALRKARPELSDPWLDEVEVDVDEEARTLVLHRGGLRLAVNLGDETVTFDLGLPIGRVLLASEPVEVDDDALTVGPESFAIAELGERPRGPDDQLDRPGGEDRQARHVTAG